MEDRTSKKNKSCVVFYLTRKRWPLIQKFIWEKAHHEDELIRHKTQWKSRSPSLHCNGQVHVIAKTVRLRQRTRNGLHNPTWHPGVVRRHGGSTFTCPTLPAKVAQTGGTCAFFLLRLDTCPLPELIALLPKRVWLFLLRFSKIDHLYSRVARVRHVHVLPR